MDILRFMRSRSAKFKHRIQPYGCFAYSDSIYYRHFWFIEDGFVEELTIIKH
jgi:hypothetical protein